MSYSGQIENHQLVITDSSGQRVTAIPLDDDNADWRLDRGQALIVERDGRTAVYDVPGGTLVERRY